MAHQRRLTALFEVHFGGADINSVENTILSLNRIRDAIDDCRFAIQPVCSRLCLC